jgi:1,4-dihydroxy-2-naphthoate octaprenyltransferase
MTSGKLIKAILSGARPKTLAAGVVPVWAGGVLAWKLSGLFDAWLWVCTLLGALCIQIATNFYNDAVDGKKGADGEGRMGPRRKSGCYGCGGCCCSGCCGGCGGCGCSCGCG